jgi:hypothetical protein
MDTNILLIIILFLLTLNFIFVSVFVILILKEMRRIIQKSELILDDVQSVTATAAKPLGMLLTLVSGLAEGFKVFQSVKDIKENSDRRKENE